MQCGVWTVDYDRADLEIFQFFLSAVFCLQSKYNM